MAFVGRTYWLPLYFQAALGANSRLSGVYLLPYVVASSFFSVGSGIFIKKSGNYCWPIITRLLVMAFGFGLMTYLGDRAR